jgi:glycosyltransferase involved in cell wall biosynthesis
LKIALDARWIFPEISGIGAYTRELARHLALLDRDNAYLLLFDNAAVMERTVREINLSSAPNFEAALVGYGVFSPGSQLRLPALLRRHKADVYHSTNYMMPLFGMGAVRRVVTIHDVIPMIFRDQVAKSRKARLYPVYRRLMIEIGKRADLILTDSRASAADIIRQLGIPPQREQAVRPVYCGVADRFRPPAARPPKLASEPRCVLYVGRADPYKNIGVLIRAFAAARGLCPFPLDLVVAGSPDPRYPEAGALAHSLGVAGHVRWTGYLSDADLAALYQRADVLVHPSRYEGFGLQVLEAMACCVPVVCSNAASLPEVAGDAALLVAPDDADGFAAGIVRVLTTPALAVEMAHKGAAQAAKFTWERTARETLRCYGEAARGAPR